MLKSTLRAFASLKLGVALLVVLAALLAWATILESSRGREAAQWYVYGSGWFIAILALLGANILAATLVRFPWKWRQLGFLLTHAGLLVLLAGAVLTFRYGVEGELTLNEGDRAESIKSTHRSLIHVIRESAAARTATDFAFAPGPVDWKAGDSLDFGESDGLGLKVLKFYRHARANLEWVEDPLDYQGPALRLRLTSPSGHTVAEDWLSASMFGGEAVIGPTMYELLPLPVDSMLEDFRAPPQEQPAGGILAIHYDGQTTRVPAEENVGNKIAVGEDGTLVEIVEYLADARPGQDGRFFSRGDQPKNPLLELLVYLPGRQEPMRQVAFAKRPLLTLDGVRGSVCPVKFWYHHTAVEPTPGAVFVQDSTGRLYCRTVVNGAYQPAQAVTTGEPVPLGGQFAVTLVRHLPHARQEVSFVSIEPAPGAEQVPEAAVLAEVACHGQRRQIWLQRANQEYGFQRIVTDQGWASVSFDYDQIPLGFALELTDFERQTNPGQDGDAAFASTVRVVDLATGVGEPRQISMNAPLTHGKFTFYQAGFQDAGHGREASTLTAAQDPGRFLKYLGSVMICVGICLMFLVGVYASACRGSEREHAEA